MLEDLLEEILRWSSKETFGGGGPIGATNMEVVQGGQGVELALTETVVAVMV